jgi:hypothetical protein
MTNLDKLQRVEASLVRWHRRLSRAANAIKKLDAQRRRLLAKKAEPVKALPAPKPAPLAIEAPRPKVSDVTDIPVTELPIPDVLDEEIPAFLRRAKPLDATAQAILDEQADLKKRKARGRIAKLKATQSGETRKMPLTGKAALAAIRGEA